MEVGPPRFRRDLDAETIEIDGVVYVEVSDPEKTNNFRFYDFEYTVAQALDGRPLDEVAQTLLEEAQLELSSEQLAAFAEQLAGLGFLEVDQPDESPAPEPAEADVPAPVVLSRPATEKKDTFFPPLTADETGEFDSPRIMASGLLDEPAASPAPVPLDETGAQAWVHARPTVKAEERPAVKAEEITRTPRPVARSLTEQTFTSFPPEVLPGSSAGASAKTPAPAAKTASTAETPPAPLFPPLEEPDALSALLEEPPRPTHTPPPEIKDSASESKGEGKTTRGAAKTSKAKSPPKAGTRATKTKTAKAASDKTPAPTSTRADEALLDVDDEEEEKTAKITDDALSPLAAAAAEAAAHAEAETAPAPKPAEPPVAPPSSDRETARATARAAEPEPAEDTTFTRPQLDTDDAFGTPDRELSPALADLATAPAAAVASMHDEPARPAAAPVHESPTPPSTPVALRERQELPTKRLRAVSGLDAEDVAETDRGAAHLPPDRAPAPLTFSPAPAPLAAAPSGQTLKGVVPGRPTWLAYAAFAVGAAVIIAAMVYKVTINNDPPRVTVRTLVPSPATIYRFWDATAKVDLGGVAAYSFPGAGKVVEVAAAGTHFGTGDVLAMLEGGRRARAELTHNRERLAFYEKMRETMTQQGNRAEARQAELKITEKKRLVAESEEALGKNAVLATQPGEVAEPATSVGATVNAGDPAVKIKGGAYRAVFELPREQAEKARQLGFCRVEIDDKPLDCSLAADGVDETHVAIELPSDPTVAAGKTAKLARDRLDAVFAIPTSALMHVGQSDRLYVVAPGLRAELRVVAVAERGDRESIVTQGIDVGDRVIVDSPPGLQPDAHLLIAETISR